MSRLSRPSTVAIIEMLLRDAARDLSLYPWRPHRAFKSNPEPVETYYQRLKELHERSKYADAEYLDALGENYVFESIGGFGKLPVTAVTVAFVKLTRELLLQNKLAFLFPRLDPDKPCDDGYRMQLHERLSELEPYLLHEARIRDVFGYIACLLIVGLLDDMPSAAFSAAGKDHDDNEDVTVPLYAFVPDMGELAQTIVATLLNNADDEADYPAALTFAHTRAQLIANVLAASRLSLEQANKHPERLSLPAASVLPPRDLIDRYFADTPFHAFLLTPVPFVIPPTLYAEHAAVFAPSGHGKTQLLQHLTFRFLAEDDPPGMVILDSQGDMLGKIERLQVFADRLKDRLVILDPEDAAPPALNFFQLGAHTGFDAQLNELFNYMFTAIDSELTAKQGTAVTYLLKLMRCIPGASIETLKDVMEEQVKSIEASRYFDKIATLDPITQAFFKNQFFDKAMAPTRNQVARRLYTILGNPIFTRMFAARENRFDALAAMRERKIVLVNTSQRVLGQEASAVFGRFIIAQVLAAAYERGAVGADQLSLLIVDEASEYFDAKTERILSQARKYGLGLLFATQYLEQMPPQVKAAVNGNTAIKLAGPVSYNDAMMLAREMYTTGDFIRAMLKADKATQFAAFVRGTTPGAITVSIPFGTLEQQPTMNETVRLQRRRENAQRYGALAQSVETTTEPVRPTQDPRSPDNPVHIAPKPWRS